MTPILLAGLWAIAATAIALMPRRTHRPGAVGLIVSGVPLLGWLTWTHGPLAGLLGLVVGTSILGWPLFHMGRWLRRKVVGRG